MIASAIVTFCATNIDGFVALSVLFATTDGPAHARLVFASAMVGFLVLLLLSGLAAAGLANVAQHSAAWFGLAPVGIGLFRLYEWLRGEPRAQVAGERGGAFPGAFFLIIATGGDNVAAYVPLFHALGSAAAFGVAAAYLGAFGGLCLAALAVCANRRLHAAIHRVAQPVSAALFIGVGCWVLVSGLR